MRVEPEPIETLRARMIGGGHAASNRVIPGKENWAWLGRYVLVMVIALVLGGLIGELDLFKQTGLGTHKLTASKLVRFLGYGGALLVLGLLSRRAARQLRDQGGKAASFGSLIVPLATLIVVVSGDSVLRIVVNPFLHQRLRSAYDWLFVCGIIAAALWLAFAIFHQAEPIGGLFKSGIAERPAGAACTACGAELLASGKFCSTCGAAAS